VFPISECFHHARISYQRGEEPAPTLRLWAISLSGIHWPEQLEGRFTARMSLRIDRDQTLFIHSSSICIGCRQQTHGPLRNEQRALPKRYPEKAMSEVWAQLSDNTLPLICSYSSAGTKTPYQSWERVSRFRIQRTPGSVLQDGQLGNSLLCQRIQSNCFDFGGEIRRTQYMPHRRSQAQTREKSEDSQ